MKTNKLFFIIGIVLTLVITGCPNVFNQLDTITYEPGKGGIELTIGDSNAQRAIVPKTELGNFEKFVLEFEPNEDCEEGNESFSVEWFPNTDENTITDIVSLDAGLWDLTVTAYLNGEAAATGSEEGIEVVSGNTVAAEIWLSPIEDGEGTFSWEFNFDDSFVNAFMEIWKLGATDELLTDKTVTFIDDGDAIEENWADKMQLDAGEYRVVLNLSDGTAYVFVSQLLHIYTNMESFYEDNFYGDLFVLSLEDFVLAMWDGTEWKFAEAGITSEHFEMIGILGVDENNFNDVVAQFNALTVTAPTDLGGLKELTDAALIVIGADADFLDFDFEYQKFAEDAIEALAVNDTALEIIWNDDKKTSTITIGNYELILVFANELLDTLEYIITGTAPSSFTVTGGNFESAVTPDTIQNIIDLIREDADGINCSIQFGSGGLNQLNITTSPISFNNTGGTWRYITLLGRITATTSSVTGTINILDDVSLESQADIVNSLNNANAKTIYSETTGEVIISGGTVSATTGQAIHSAADGKIIISGTAEIISSNATDSLGTIFIANTSDTAGSRLELRGGTVRNTVTNTSARVIYNSSNGDVIINSGSVLAETSGFAIVNSSTGKIIVNGGTVSAIGGGRGIVNHTTGEIHISGGTVSSVTGMAIDNLASGKIFISGTAVITSAPTGTNIGTIAMRGGEPQLEMSGGLVRNTANVNGARAIYNNSNGEIIISGGRVAAETLEGVGTEGVAILNSSNGKITISGTTEVTSASTLSTIGTILINTNEEARLEIKGGAVRNTANVNTGRAINNTSPGAVDISGGTVSALAGQAINNSNTGKITISGTGTLVTSENTNSEGTIVISGTQAAGIRLEITGGTVSNTAINNIPRAIFNSSTNGEVVVSGGTVSTAIREAIFNNNLGKITISGDNTLITSGNPVLGTIVIDTNGTATLPRLEITGGTVRNTSPVATTRTIYNNSTGAVNISNATISAMAGIAILNNSTGAVNIDNVTVSSMTGPAIQNNTIGRITISGTGTLITSAIETADSGTINIIGSQAAGTRLEVNGATVRNSATGSNGNAIYNSSTNGAVTVNSGNVSTTATNGFAIQHTAANSNLVFDGAPAIAGRIRVGAAGRLSVISETFTPGTNNYVLDFANPINNAIMVVNGEPFINNFSLWESQFNLVVNGSNLVIGTAPYTFEKIGNTYIITRIIGGAYANIQAAINAIRTETDGADCSIQFEKNGLLLNIGSSNVTFNGNWGTVTLLGRIASSITGSITGTVIISDDVSIESLADISNVTTNASVAGAVYSTSTGEVIISGGTVSAAAGTNGFAIINAGYGKVIISGDNTLITSANTAAASGTIIVGGNQAAVQEGTRLEINGGTVNNTSTGNAIFKSATNGAVININGGTVSSPNGFAIQYSAANVAASTSIVLNGTPNISGRINAGDGSLSVVPATFVPGTNTYLLDFANLAHNMVMVVNGGSYLNNFSIPLNEFRLVADNSDIVLRLTGYNFAKAETTYTITNAVDGTYADIQSAIDAIKIDAGGEDCSIRFGNGVLLDIGAESVNFNNNDGNWGVITLLGNIRSRNAVTTAGTIVITDDVLVESQANIANIAAGSNGKAIYHTGTGIVTINSGTVSATTGFAVYNASTGKIIVSGDIWDETTQTGTLITSAMPGNTAATPAGTIYIADSGSGGTRLEITGGTIANTASTAKVAVNNASTGIVDISGGRIFVNIGYSVFNSGTGKINVLGNAFITSGIAGSTDQGTASIHLANTGTDTAARLEITGGIIEGIGNSQPLITNQSAGAIRIRSGIVRHTARNNFTITILLTASSTGALNISGGTVTSQSGQVIRSQGSGLITISGDAMLSSDVWGSRDGVIYLESIGSNDVGLIIEGGTIHNSGTATNPVPRTILNRSTRGVIIRGGTISNAVTNGYAVLFENANAADATLTLENNPVITGIIQVMSTTTAGRLSLGSTFTPNGTYTLDFATPEANIIAVTGIRTFADSFVLPAARRTAWRLEAAGGNLMLRTNP